VISQKGAATWISHFWFSALLQDLFGLCRYLHGRPVAPGVARAPSARAIALPKHSSPNAKFPFVADRM
jgi:hypothetical protein